MFIYNPKIVITNLGLKQISSFTSNDIAVARVYATITNKAGETIQFEIWAYYGIKSYKLCSRKFTFANSHNQQYTELGSCIIDGGKLQKQFNIPSNTNAKIQFCVKFINPSVSPAPCTWATLITKKIQQDIQILKVIPIDANRNAPVNIITRDRNYYFRVEYRAKGYAGDTFYFNVIGYKPNDMSRYFSITRWSDRLTGTFSDYEYLVTSSPYGVTGKWLCEQFYKAFGCLKSVGIGLIVTFNNNKKEAGFVYPVGGDCMPSICLSAKKKVTIQFTDISASPTNPEVGKPVNLSCSVKASQPVSYNIRLYKKQGNIAVAKWYEKGQLVEYVYDFKSRGMNIPTSWFKITFTPLVTSEYDCFAIAPDGLAGESWSTVSKKEFTVEA